MKGSERPNLDHTNYNDYYYNPYDDSYHYYNYAHHHDDKQHYTYNNDNASGHAY